MIKRLIGERVIEPLQRLLMQGTHPRALATSVTLGALIGISPLFGITTTLCVVVAGVARLNQVAIQIGNYAVYALQIVLIIPFMRAGETLLGLPRAPLSGSVIARMAEDDLLGLLGRYGVSLGAATLAWLIVVVTLFVPVRSVLTRLFARAQARRRGKQASDEVTVER